MHQGNTLTSSRTCWRETHFQLVTWEFGSDPTERGAVFIEEGQPEQGRAIWQAPRERQAVG